MRASAWAHARAEGTPAAILSRIPDLCGSDGARLRTRGEVRPLPLPSGAARITATWHVDGTFGDAEMTLLPLSSWGSEVHIALASPASLPRRLLWRPRRLTRLAERLVMEVASAAAHGRAPALRTGHRPRVESAGVASR